MTALQTLSQKPPKTLPPLPLNSKIKVIMPMGVISLEGRMEINRILNNLDLSELPDWWDYKTQVTGRGEYVGSFCKRVAKYYYQTNDIKITSDDLGIIGSVMASHTNKNDQYVLDYTQDFDWIAGDFGDEGSCFWTCHRDAKMALENDKACAVRFFNSQNSGIARAWICHRSNYLQIFNKQNEYYVVFNGYGLETSDIARIMAHQLNLSYRRIELSNYGEKEGRIWINGSRGKSEDFGSGFAIGPESVVHGMTQADLKIEANRIVCSECDEISEIFHEDNGCVYCEECFAGRYSECCSCGEYYRHDNMINTNSGVVCHRCFDEYFAYCEYCDIHYHCDSINIINNQQVCGICKNYNFTNCDKCNSTFPNDDIYHIDQMSICSECKDEKEATDELI